MPADGVSLIFGFKISEDKMKKIFNKYEHYDDFDTCDFSEYLEQFFAKLSKKFKIKFGSYHPPCCAYKQNKFFVLGIYVCYFSCYDFAEIKPKDMQKITNAKIR